MIGRLYRAIAICLSTLCASSAIGQTVVGGVIDTDTTWDSSGSPYQVTETIVVTGGATLTIHTDVDVDFDEGQGLLVGPGGSGGTGELRVLGTGGTMRSGYVFFVGGTGIRMGTNTVHGRLDPDTGEYLDGSIIRNARLRYVQPELFSTARFALNCAGGIPYLDSLGVSFVTGGGGIRVNMSGSGLTRVRWARIDVHDIDGTGVLVSGGTRHVIGTLNASEVRTIDADGAAFRAERLLIPSADEWDVSILGGVFRDIEAPAAIGAGIAKLRLEGMTFQRCRSLAVDADDSGALELTECIFEDNHRHVVGDAQATVRGCTFTRSGASRPVSLARSASFENCRFENNIGPALYATRATTVRDCDFIGNTATDAGGAIVGFTLDLFDSTFTRNSADRGGAVLAGIVYGYGNTYVSNTATYGGAIFFGGRRSLLGREGDPEVFIGNTATEGGGAIYVDGDGIDLLAARFERNSAFSGGAIHVGPYGHSLNYSTPGGTGSLMRDNVASVGPAIYVDPPALPIGLADLDAPCVDWGTRDRDAIGARIFDGNDAPGRAVVVFDPVGPCGMTCVADFDGDGELTIFDFLAFQTAFDAGDAKADLDGDGELTLFDFLVFQTAFDAGCA